MRKIRIIILFCIMALSFNQLKAQCKMTKVTVDLAKMRGRTIAPGNGVFYWNVSGTIYGNGQSININQINFQANRGNDVPFNNARVIPNGPYATATNQALEFVVCGEDLSQYTMVLNFYFNGGFTTTKTASRTVNLATFLQNGNERISNEIKTGGGSINASWWFYVKKEAIPTPKYYLPSEFTVCENELPLKIDLRNYDIPEGSYPNIVLLNSNGQVPGQISNIVTIPTSGDYVLLSDNNYQCVLYETFHVTVHQLTQITNQDQYTLCWNDHLVISAATQDPPGEDLSPYEYTWKDPAGNCIGYAQNITLSELGTYTLEVTNKNGCTSTKQIQVVNPTLPAAEFPTGTELNLCNVAPSPIQLQLSASYASYQWNDGSTNSTLSVNESGKYSVQVVDAEGCSSEASIEIIEPCNDNGFRKLEGRSWVAFITKSDFQDPAKNTIGISDPRYPYSADDRVSRTNIVRLQYHRSDMTDDATSQWNLYVDYEATMILDGVTHTENGRLALQKSNASDNVYEAANSHGNAEDISIQILDAYLIDQSSTHVANLSTIPDDIVLELEMKIHHQKRLTTTVTNVNHVIDNTNGKLKINWRPLPSAVEYEVQFAYWDRYTRGTVPTTETLFKEKGWSIQAPKNEVIIDATFPEGTLYYRIRPIGKHLLDNNEDITKIDQGTFTSVRNIAIVPSGGGTSSINAFEPDENWSKTITFAEEGKKKEVISYMDDNLRPTQVVTNLNTNKLSLVAESYYDYESRATLNVLPVPVTDNNLFMKNPIATSGGNPIDPVFVDNPIQQPVDPTSTVATYYSPQNPFLLNTAYTNIMSMENIPDANGYVTTKVEYSRDNTGRVIRQSGVGEEFIIDEMGQKHYTQYFYGTPTQLELHRLFGENVGEAVFYSKQMVVDPNGQVSVSYLDNKEKTIATALSGDAPANLTALDIPIITTPPISLMGNNIVDEELKESKDINIILNDKVNKIYNFHYNPKSGINNLNTINGNPYCTDCAYELEIYITDPKGFEVPITLTSSIPNVQLLGNKITGALNTDACPNTDPNYERDWGTIDFEATFQRLGDYTIYKRLKLLNGEPLTEYSEIISHFTTPPLPPLQTYIEQHLDDYVDANACKLDCPSLAQAYVDQLKKEDIAKNEEKTPQEYLDIYNDKVEECEEPGAPFDGLQIAEEECENILQMMGQQLAPPRDLINPPAGNYFNLAAQTFLSLRNNLYYIPRITSKLGADALNIDDKEILAKAWQPEWGVKFIWIFGGQLHPEYCHYENCLAEMDIRAKDFDLIQLSGIDAAIDGNYLEDNTPGNPSDFDFSIGSALQTEMINYQLYADRYVLLSAVGYPDVYVNLWNAIRPGYQITLGDGTVFSANMAYYYEGKEEYIADKIDVNDNNILEADEKKRLYWINFLSGFLNIKQNFLADERELGGCEYFTAPASSYAVVQDPRLPKTRDEALEDYNEQMAQINFGSHCAQMAEYQFDFLMSECPALQAEIMGSPSFQTIKQGIITKFAEICVAESNVENPGGWVLEGNEEAFDDLVAYINGLNLTATCNVAAILTTNVSFQNGNCGNLIPNGDFEDGNTGFLSDYAFSANTYPGEYFVDVFAYGGGSWTPCQNPSHGKFMIIDGTPYTTQRFWYNTYNGLSANTNYEFSFEAISVYPSNYANIMVNINGQTNNFQLNTNSNNCNWQKYTVEVNTGAGTSLNIALSDLEGELNGNDFAIDNISLKKKDCGEPYVLSGSCKNCIDNLVDEYNNYLNKQFVRYEEVGTPIRTYSFENARDANGNYNPNGDFDADPIYMHPAGDGGDMTGYIISSIHQLYNYSPHVGPYDVRIGVPDLPTSDGADVAGGMYLYHGTQGVPPSGSNVYGANVWKTRDNNPIPVTPGKYYRISYKFIDLWNLYNPSGGLENPTVITKLKVFVNDAPIHHLYDGLRTPYTLYNQEWMPFEHVWQAPPGVTQMNIRIFNEESNGLGNDFLIDEIVVQEVDRIECSVYNGDEANDCECSVALDQHFYPDVTFEKYYEDFEGIIPGALTTDAGYANMGFPHYNGLIISDASQIPTPLQNNYQFENHPEYDGSANPNGHYAFYATSRLNNNDGYPWMSARSFVGAIGDKYYFSFMVNDLTRINPDMGDFDDGPELAARLIDLNGNSIRELVNPEIIVMQDNWVKYVYTIDITRTYPEFKLAIFNYNDDSWGNNFLLDNIIFDTYETSYSNIDCIFEDSRPLVQKKNYFKFCNNSEMGYYGTQLPELCCFPKIKLLIANSTGGVIENKPGLTRIENPVFDASANPLNMPSEYRYLSYKATAYYFEEGVYSSNEVYFYQFNQHNPEYCENGPFSCYEFNLTRQECQTMNILDLPDLGFDPNHLSNDVEDCIARQEALATEILTQLYYEELYSIASTIATETANKCLDALNEDYYYTTTFDEYHYTLYYYDQAGNLVSTVPPAGVYPLDASAFTSLGDPRGSGVWLGDNPKHALHTIYAYNSRNQVREQFSPDGGTTNFYYNDKGQLILSQNAKQVLNGVYSFTHYDELGRIILVGEIEGDHTAHVQELSFPFAPLTGTPYGTIEQLTYTVYDDPVLNTGLVQENLRNRVSATYYFDNYSDLLQQQGVATIYNYDEIGNVKTVVQDLSSHPELQQWDNLASNGWMQKRIDYSYDLISGKVNEVVYQPGQDDQFIHRYEYDADNRITDVYTSKDQIIETKEAKYFYFPHGPLARVELGNNKVQGINYAYTLQGWLKGMGNKLGQPNVPATTGLYQRIPKNEVEYYLAYYKNDYTNIASTPFNSTPVFENIAPYYNSSNLTTLNLNGLYNGNISATVTYLYGLLKNNTKYADIAYIPNWSQYTYDQLNRIKTAEAKSAFNPYYTHNPTILGGLMETHKANYTYDGNGNLLTLNRWALHDDTKAMQQMDALEYHYGRYSEDGHNKLFNNRLYYVNDYQNQHDFEGDIDTRTGAFDEFITGTQLEAPFGANYTYDAIGNMTKDEAEGIDDIQWTVYGKIDSITYDPSKNKPNTRFIYDATGNRIAKINGTNATFYFRDAQGNPMDVVDVNEEQPLSNTYNELKHEYNLYGSSRVGIFRDVTYLTPIPTLGTYGENARFMGMRDYELTNHLGNVLATVSDLKYTSTTIPGTYEADVLATQDYFPFGMLIPEKQYTKAPPTEPEPECNYSGGTAGNGDDDNGENTSCCDIVVPEQILLNEGFFQDGYAQLNPGNTDLRVMGNSYFLRSGVSYNINFTIDQLPTNPNLHLSIKRYRSAFEHLNELLSSIPVTSTNTQAAFNGDDGASVFVLAVENTATNTEELLPFTVNQIVITELEHTVCPEQVVAELDNSNQSSYYNRGLWTVRSANCSIEGFLQNNNGVLLTDANQSCNGWLMYNALPTTSGQHYTLTLDVNNLNNGDYFVTIIGTNYPYYGAFDFDFSTVITQQYLSVGVNEIEFYANTPYCYVDIRPINSSGINNLQLNSLTLEQYDPLNCVQVFNETIFSEDYTQINPPILPVRTLLNNGSIYTSPFYLSSGNGVHLGINYNETYNGNDIINKVTTLNNAFLVQPTYTYDVEVTFGSAYYYDEDDVNFSIQVVDLSGNIEYSQPIVESDLINGSIQFTLNAALTSSWSPGNHYLRFTIEKDDPQAIIASNYLYINGVNIIAEEYQDCSLLTTPTYEEDYSQILGNTSNAWISDCSNYYNLFITNVLSLFKDTRINACSDGFTRTSMPVAQDELYTLNVDLGNLEALEVVGYNNSDLEAVLFVIGDDANNPLGYVDFLAMEKLTPNTLKQLNFKTKTHTQNIIIGIRLFEDGVTSQDQIFPLIKLDINSIKLSAKAPCFDNTCPLQTLVDQDYATQPEAYKSWFSIDNNVISSQSAGKLLLENDEAIARNGTFYLFNTIPGKQYTVNITGEANIPVGSNASVNIAVDIYRPEPLTSGSGYAFGQTNTTDGPFTYTTTITATNHTMAVYVVGDNFSLGDVFAALTSFTIEAPYCPQDCGSELITTNSQLQEFISSGIDNIDITGGMVHITGDNYQRNYVYYALPTEIGKKYTVSIPVSAINNFGSTAPDLVEGHVLSNLISGNQLDGNGNPVLATTLFNGTELICNFVATGSQTYFAITSQVQTDNNLEFAIGAPTLTAYNCSYDQCLTPRPDLSSDFANNPADCNKWNAAMGSLTCSGVMALNSVVTPNDAEGIGTLAMYNMPTVAGNTYKLYITIDGNNSYGNIQAFFNGVIATDDLNQTFTNGYNLDKADFTIANQTIVYPLEFTATGSTTTIVLGSFIAGDGNLETLVRNIEVQELGDCCSGGNVSTTWTPVTYTNSWQCGMSTATPIGSDGVHIAYQVDGTQTNVQGGCVLEFDVEGGKTYRVRYNIGNFQQHDITYNIDGNGSVLVSYNPLDPWATQYGNSTLGSGSGEFIFTARIGDTKAYFSAGTAVIFDPNTGNPIGEASFDIIGITIEEQDIVPMQGPMLVRTYRFGFNGKEMDNEVSGNGNQYDYGFRIYNPRLGKFLSVDPLTTKYPELTPYQFAANTPIQAIDLDGLEVLLVGKQESGAAFVGVQLEAGILYDFKNKALFSYTCAQGGLTSTVSASSGISITYYPKMPSAYFATGWGYSAGVGGGELYVGSVDAAYSSGYWGINVSFGIGGSLAPVDGHAYAGYTKIKTITAESAKKYTKYFTSAISSINSKISELSAKNLKLKEENKKLNSNSQELLFKKKNATYDDQKEINKQIDANQKKTDSNESSIINNNKDILELEGLKSGMEEAKEEISKVPIKS
ncbi:MAG: hypothetical protein K1X55_00395 [Chitinophagales bacterium]|nr:hypothetical protein [Chitinophagales bacterium]